MKFHVQSAIAFAVLILLLGSCDALTGPAKAPDVVVTGVTLNLNTAAVNVGSTVVLAPTVTPSNATKKDVTWVSTRPNIATVTSGVVTGISAGTTTVVVTTVDGGFTALCDVTVNASGYVSPYTGLTLNKATSTLTVGGTEQLTSTYTPADAPVPSIVWTTSNSAAATVGSTGLVVAVAPGTAVIKAVTSDGKVFATCTYTIVGSTNSTDSVKAGLASLGAMDLNAARTAFAGALTQNSSDNDAKIWSVFMELTSLSVHPEVVNMMKNRIGVVDYPADMNTLLTNKWFNSKFYGTKKGIRPATGSDRGWLVRGSLTAASGSSVWVYDVNYQSASKPNSKFTPDANGSWYADYWYDGTTYQYSNSYLVNNPSVTGYSVDYNLVDLLNAQPFPTLAPVAGFVPSDASGQPNGYTMSDWSRLFAVNVLSRNPSGLNAMVDQVLAGPYGASFDALVSRLGSVDATYRTEVPAFLYAAAVPTGAGAPTIPKITIGKPELLLLAASLKAQKAFLQYVAAVSLDYPAVIPNFLNGIKTYAYSDTNNNKIDDRSDALFATNPGVYTSALLTERNAASRVASKASFLSALADIKAAVDLYKTALGDPDSYYRSSVNSYWTSASPSAKPLDYTPALTALGNASTAVTKVSDAIANNTPLIVPLTNGNQMLMLSDLIGTTLVWPTVETPGSTATVKPGVLWAENMVNLRNWFETDSSGFVPYVTINYSTNVYPVGFPKVLPADRNSLTGAFYGLDTAVTSGSTQLSLYVNLALKVKLSQLQKLWPDATANMVGMVPMAGWYVVGGGGYSVPYVNGLPSYTYTYQLKPDLGSEGFLGWLNR